MMLLDVIKEKNHFGHGKKFDLQTEGKNFE